MGLFYKFCINISVLLCACGYSLFFASAQSSSASPESSSISSGIASSSSSSSPNDECTESDLNEALGRSARAPLPAFGEFIRGDANGDSQVTAADLSAIQQFITTQDIRTVRSFDAADINNDNNIDQKDTAYLRNFLAGTGPKPPLPFAEPAALGPFFCLKSPCNVITQGTVVQFSARRVKRFRNKDNWRATALNYSTKKVIAQYDLAANYEAGKTTYEIAYKGFGSPLIPGDVDSLGATVAEDSGECPVTSGGGTQEFDTNQALQLMGQLVDPVTGSFPVARDGNPPAGKPGGGNQDYPRCPNGCSAPVNLPLPSPPNAAETACCNTHDSCFAVGGSENDFDRCNDEFWDCMSKARSKLCKFFRIFSLPLPLVGPMGDCIATHTFFKNNFRWHENDCTCMSPGDLEIACATNGGGAPIITSDCDGAGSETGCGSCQVSGYADIDGPREYSCGPTPVPTPTPSVPPTVEPSPEASSSSESSAEASSSPSSEMSVS